MSTYLTGPDVSFYQDAPSTPQQIDFAKMKAAGASFVIIRAGQNTWIDPDFTFNWKAAKDAGIPRGLYWFYDSRSSPRTQTDKLKEAVGADYPECGVWADFEERYGGNYGSQERLREFMELLKDAFPSTVEIGVYTAYYWWVSRVTERAYWIQYPLWVANYQTPDPLVPPPWGPNGWSFWQYTDKGDGLKYGVESLNIDMNYYNGSESEFAERYSVIVAPPTGEPMNGTYQMKTVSQDTRLRPEHNTALAYIALIPAGTVLTGTELFIAPAGFPGQVQGDMWLKTTYAGKTGWVAYVHGGVFICGEFKILALPETDVLDKPDITISTPDTEHYPASELTIHPK